MDDDEDVVKLSKKYFWFLVTEYGFNYDEKLNAFDNGYVRYRIERIDRDIQSIEVWLKSEPKYTRIDVSWLIDKYIDRSETDRYLFEDMLSYYAGVFQKYSQELLYDLDELLLDGLKKLIVSH